MGVSFARRPTTGSDYDFKSLRMSTSRLYVDPEYIARAAEDDWAKYVIQNFNLNGGSN